MSRPMLEVVDLTKVFPVRNALGRQSGEVRAVDGVSFSIERGQVYGLAGESGSGKSTIARMIMGLASPTSGDILLDGNNIAGANGSRAGKVQMVFQNPGSSLNPRRTAGQSIAVPLTAHGHPRGDRARRSRPPPCSRRHPASCGSPARTPCGSPSGSTKTAASPTCGPTP